MVAVALKEIERNSSPRVAVTTLLFLSFSEKKRNADKSLDGGGGGDGCFPRLVGFPQHSSPNYYHESFKRSYRQSLLDGIIISMAIAC